MSTVLPRYDLWGVDWSATPQEEPHAEGEWVKAQDAYDKLAVLDAQIATLKTQLKDARKEIVQLLSEKRK
jgi:hypothetical protein